MKRLLVIGLFSLACCGDDDAVIDAAVMDVPTTDTDATDAAPTEDGGPELDASIDDVGPADDASMPDGLRALCQADFARDTRCPPDEPRAVDECAADPEEICRFSLFREDATAAIAECVENLPCDEADDGCFDATNLGLTESEASMAFTAACASRRGECLEEDEAFSDDFCFLNIGRDEVIGTMNDCLLNDCFDIPGCFLDVFSCAE